MKVGKQVERGKLHARSELVDLPKAIRNARRAGDELASLIRDTRPWSRGETVGDEGAISAAATACSAALGRLKNALEKYEYSGGPVGEGVELTVHLEELLKDIEPSSRLRAEGGASTCAFCAGSVTTAEYVECCGCRICIGCSFEAAGGAGFGCPTCGANLGDQAARPRADTRASLSTGAGRGQRQGNGASASAAAGVATSGNRRETAAERAARVHKILDDALSEPAGTAGARKERTLLECGFAYSAAAKGAAASASASAGRGFGGAADVMGRVGGHGSAPFKPPRAKETATAGASHTWAETPTGGSSGATGWGQHGVLAPFKPPARQSTPAPPERGAGRRHSPQQQEEDYKRPRTA